MSRSRKRKKKYRGLRIFIRIQMFFMLLAAGGLAYYFLGGYAGQVNELSREARQLVRASDEETFRAVLTGVVYDARGGQISVLKGEKDVYYLSIEEIPKNVTAAMVSIEDKKFYTHSGVDYKAIVRAGLAMLRNGEATQGGSTITQQLARCVFLSQEKTWQRKMEEIFIATELEKKYSKDQILEFYLNNIYFGNGFYGIQAASRGYFSADAQNLNLSQIAYLCAIPNNPTLYDPYTNSDNTIKRRNRILDNMEKDGKITHAACQLAKAEDITLNPSKTSRNNYVETYVYYCAARALMESRGFVFQYEFETNAGREEYEKAYGELYQECERSLYTGGYRIYTSIDPDMQNMLQKAVDERLSDYTEQNGEGIYTLQGAAVCIDNQSGRVAAIVGGREQEYHGYTLNRAFQSYRQPGSAIKPLLVYTPLLEREYTPDTIVRDEPIEGGPVNAGGGYAGDVTLRYAVEKSINTIAWRLFETLTPSVGLSYLREMNFAKLDRGDANLSAALGGFTNGVSPVEMTAGYAAIENDGKYRIPTCITKIQNAQGEDVYLSGQQEKVIYKENAARTMTDILQGVLTKGTAAGLSLEQTASAGKTGTTNSNKDGWFVGYTKYYTTSVWVGYDMPKELPGLTGSGYPAQIWHTFMEQLHSDLPYAAFVAPAGENMMPETATEGDGLTEREEKEGERE